MLKVISVSMIIVFVCKQFVFSILNRLITIKTFEKKPVFIRISKSEYHKTICRHRFKKKNEVKNVTLYSDNK